MGTMRPNKYDVTTAYGLCQDYLPPDGGDFGCIMCSRRVCNNVTVCEQQSHTPSCRRNCLSNLRHFKDTKYNDTRPPGFCEQRFQNCTLCERHTKIFVLQQKLETCSIELQNTCYFNETIVHGYFVFRSVVDVQRRIGFTHRGKAVGPKKNINDACYLFTKIQADEFFYQHTSATTSTSTATVQTASQAATTTPTQSMQRIKNKRRNQNLQLQRKQQLNGHNSNISLYLSSNNSNQEQNQQQQQQLVLENVQKIEHQNHHTHHHHNKHHQVRHHHNSPDIIARRHHHGQNPKRKSNQRSRLQVNVSSTTIATPMSTATSRLNIAQFITPTAFKTSGTTLKMRPTFNQKEVSSTTLPTTRKYSTISDNTLYSSTSTRKTVTAVSNKGKARRRKHKKHGQKVYKGSGSSKWTTTESNDDDVNAMSSLSSMAWHDFTSSMSSFAEESPTPYFTSKSQQPSTSGDEIITQYAFKTSPTVSFEWTPATVAEKSLSRFATIESTNSIKFRNFTNHWNYPTTKATRSQQTTFNDDLTTASSDVVELTASTVKSPRTEHFSFSFAQTKENPKQSVIKTTASSSRPTNLSPAASSTKRRTVPAVKTTTFRPQNITSASTLAISRQPLKSTTPTVNWLLNPKRNQTNAHVDESDNVVGIAGNISKNNLTEYSYRNRSSTNKLNKQSDIANITAKENAELSKGKGNGMATTTTTPKKQRKSTIKHSFRPSTPAATAATTTTQTAATLLPLSKPLATPTTNLLQILSPLADTRTLDPNEQKYINNAHINNGLELAKPSPPLMTMTTLITPRITAITTNRKHFNSESKNQLQLTSPSPSSASKSKSSTPVLSYTSTSPTIWRATTTRRGVRKSTQKLLATPFHQLTTYVRNKAGDIDIDNIDNINVYPEIADADGNVDNGDDATFGDYDDLHLRKQQITQHKQLHADIADNINIKYNSGNNSNSRLIVVSGYLPTSPSATLPTSLQIAKHKILSERQHRRSLRRFVGSSNSSVA